MFFVVTVPAVIIPFTMRMIAIVMIVMKVIITNVWCLQCCVDCMMFVMCRNEN